MSIFHAKMSMLGTFSIMPGTVKLKYTPVHVSIFDNYAKFVIESWSNWAETITREICTSIALRKAYNLNSKLPPIHKFWPHKKMVRQVIVRAI